MTVDESIALLTIVANDKEGIATDVEQAMATLLLELERRTRQPALDDEAASIVNRLRTIG